MSKYMSSEFLHTCGVGISVLNGALMILCLVIGIKEFMRLLAPETKDNRSFHWLMLSLVLSFLVANYYAYHRFYDAWVKAEVVHIQMDLIMMGVKDRAAMGVCGIIMYLLSSRYRGSWFEGKYEDED